MNRAVTAVWTALLCIVGILRAASAADGITEREIVFGQVAALSGPASALGQGMRLGIEAAFAEINARGGIHGRRLLLVSRDDGYDPDRSLAETRRSLDEDKVFALIGAVGTPTSIVAAPLAAAAGVPFIAPFTGADLLRDQKLTTIVNLRASYAAEAQAWVRYLVATRRVSRIAIFYQDDAFGRDALAGLKAALDAHGIDLVAEATYERNTVAVRSAVRTLARAAPEAVVMVGSYKPCAEFVHQARRTGFNPVFVNISFVGADALADELGAEGLGVIVSQVVPPPWDKSIKAVADYQRALRAFDWSARPGFVSLEGYLAGRLVARALDRLGPAPTREGLLAELRQDRSLLPRTAPTSSDGDTGRDAAPVFMTEIGEDGAFRSLPSLDEAGTRIEDLRGSHL